MVRLINERNVIQWQKRKYIYDVHTTDSGTGAAEEPGRIHCMEMWGIDNNSCNSFMVHGKSIFSDGSGGIGLDYNVMTEKVLEKTQAP